MKKLNENLNYVIPFVGLALLGFIGDYFFKDHPNFPGIIRDLSPVGRGAVYFGVTLIPFGLYSIINELIIYYKKK
ncbi:hypothetical protein OAM70_04455 [Pelagibacteraceae bacterium]|nr:hypothetical protein [Pelagibacteraceae bacterium]